MMNWLIMLYVSVPALCILAGVLVTAACMRASQIDQRKGGE